jgi:hypothetical protein
MWSRADRRARQQRYECDVRPINSGGLDRIKSLVRVAKSVEAAGADAISLINAPRAMCIDYTLVSPL